MASNRSSKTLKIVIPLVVVLLVAIGVGVWYFFIREETVATKDIDEAAAAECGTSEAPASIDGEWTVATDCPSEVLLRIKEEFANGLKDYEAVGSMEDVSGSIAIDGSEISTGTFTIDLSTLTFVDTGSPVPASGRANAMKDDGLETESFPEASFELTEPIDLGEVPADGAEITVPATGELTLHGETKPVELELKALLTGDTIQVSTSGVPVVLADYGINKPTAPFVADVADEGSFEFTIFLKQG